MAKETEAERAAFYEANKDNPEVWDEAVEYVDPCVTDHGLAITVTVHFDPKDAVALRHLAEVQNLSYVDAITHAVATMAQRATTRPFLRYESAALWAGTVMGGLGLGGWELGHGAGVAGAGVGLFMGAFLGNALVKLVIMIGLLAHWWG